LATKINYVFHKTLMFRKVFRIFAVVIICNLDAFLMRTFYRFVLVAGNLIKHFFPLQIICAVIVLLQFVHYGSTVDFKALMPRTKKVRGALFCYIDKASPWNNYSFRARRNLYYYYYHYFSREVSKRRSNQR
jgi:hypothetical protein